MLCVKSIRISFLYSRYTRDIFIYRLVNHALRLQEIDIIWKFGYFIKDLYMQLERLYTETPSEKRARITYRGQM